MSLTHGQELGYNVMMAGYNTFLTGGAGVGKTYTLNKFVDDSVKQGKNVMLTAPTGIAALNIGGVTIHRQFEAPVGVITYNKDSYDPSDELVYTDIVIIDEISMCRIDLFEFVCNKILDANARRKRHGLKVIQLIVSGDFFQLPPVILPAEKVKLDDYYGQDIGVGFAFQSKMWELFDFKSVLLTEIVRQSDQEFIGNLNRVRVGEKAYIDYIFNNACNKEIESAITICGTNAEANKKNEIELSKINSPYVTYTAELNGDVNQSDVTVDFNLVLKEGARVMTLVNAKGDGYRNGQLGVVVALYDNSVVIQMDDGYIQYVDRFEFEVFRYELENVDGVQKLVEKRVGSVKQFPVKLAYAITIHKSQGQTYDAVNLSPYSWDCGQLYVAISRVKSLDKLHFNYKPDMQYIVVSLNVIKFYNSLNIATEEDIERAVNQKQETVEKTDIDYDMEKILSLL